MMLTAADQADVVVSNLITSTALASVWLLVFWVWAQMKTWHSAAHRAKGWLYGLLLLGWFTFIGCFLPHFGKATHQQRSLSNHEWPVALSFNNHPHSAQTSQHSRDSPSSLTLLQGTKPTEKNPPSKPFKELVLGFWLLGCGLLLLRLLWNYLRTFWLVRTLERNQEPALEGITEELAAKLGLTKAPPIVFCATQASPALTGLFSPKIVLPIGAKNWDHVRLRCCLAHELAHQKRNDLLHDLLATCIVCFHWFNPLAWLALSDLRTEREEACDQRACDLGIKASDYAQALFQLTTEMSQKSGNGICGIAMAHRSKIAMRIAKVLSPKTPHRSSTFGKAALGICLMSALPLTVLKARVHGNHIGPQTQTQLAENAFHNGDWHGAARWYQDLDSNPNQSPSDWYRYAFSLEQIHQMDRASRAMFTAFQLAGYPDSAFISFVTWHLTQGNAPLAQRVWQSWHQFTNPKMMVMEKPTGTLPILPVVAMTPPNDTESSEMLTPSLSLAKNSKAMERLYQLQQEWSQNYPQALTCQSFRWVAVLGHDHSQPLKHTVWFGQKPATIHSPTTTHGFQEPNFIDASKLMNLENPSLAHKGVLSCSLIINSHGTLLGLTYYSLPQDFDSELFENTLKTMRFRPGMVNGHPVTGHLPFAMGFRAN